MSSPLRCGLVANGHLLEALSVDEDVLGRMARRRQGLAMGLGLDGQVSASLWLQPQRGAPSLAGGLRWVLSHDGRTFCDVAPVSCLEPLIAPHVTAVRQAAQIAPEITVGYIVPCPHEPGPHWQADLTPFAGVEPAAVPAAASLFPDVAHPLDAPIVAVGSALQQAVAWCQGAVEKGGVLLGRLHRQENGVLWVKVVAFVPATEGAVADERRIHFSAEAWRGMCQASARIEQEMGCGAPLSIVGWVHSHVGADADMLFFSLRDALTMAQHFAEPYCVGLVCLSAADASVPLHKRMAAFGWSEDGVSVVPRDMGIIEEESSLEERYASASASIAATG